MLMHMRCESTAGIPMHKSVRKSYTLGMLPTTRMLAGAFCQCQMLTMAMEMMVTVSGPIALSTSSFLSQSCSTLAEAHISPERVQAQEQGDV